MLGTLAKLLVSKKVAIPSVASLPFVGAYLYTRLTSGNESKEDEQKTEQSTKSQTQPKQQTTKTTKTRHTIPQTVQQQQEATTPPEQGTSTVGAFLPELAKLYQLSSLFALQYEQDAKTYYNIFQQYSEKLEKIIPIMTMTLAKTPLSQITSEDLPEKLYTMFKYYSWDFSSKNFPKVLQGYYLIKANGGDTSNLTITDLIVASENQALAQGVNENFVMMLNNIAEVYKINMQGALDQIGKLKDVYAFKLNTLKAQADMIDSIVKAIADEEKRKFEQYIKIQDLKLKEARLASDISYRNAKLGLEREKLDQKLNPDNLQIKVQSSKETK